MTKESVERKRKLGITFSGGSDGLHKFCIDEADALERIFGTDCPDMATGLMRHCLKVLRTDEANEEHPANDERAFMFASVAEMQPRDAVERLLAVQMAATHVAMMRAGRCLATARLLQQTEAHYTGFTKLARTFTAQVEALRKHRNGGKQTVTVQHVNVGDGGQAIVGTVQGGGANAKK